MTDEYDNPTENNQQNQDNTGSYHERDQDVNQTPSYREHDPAFTVNRMTVKVILTESEINKYKEEKHYPSTREGVRLVNGQLVEVIEELYRIDHLGRAVRNDNIAGFSRHEKLPIPSDLYGICPDHFDRHERPEGPIAVNIGKDGVRDRESNTVLCAFCLKMYKCHLAWQKRTLGLIKAPELKPPFFP